MTYDNRLICGRFCNFSSYSSPAINFVGLLTPPGGQPLLATQNSNKSVYDAYNLAANVHYEINDTFTIDNILAYQSWDTEFGVDDDLSPIPLSGGFNSLTHWNWSEELRLSARLADTATLVVGGYYFDQQTNYYSYQDLRYIAATIPGLGYVPLFPLQFIQPDETPADAWAGFANVDWEIIPGLTFNGGVRYTEESKEYHYFRLNPDGTINAYLDPVGAANGAGTPGALTGLVALYEGQRWDWRAALNYRFSDAVMVYASVSTGFKGGGTNPRPFYASQAIGVRSRSAHQLRDRRQDRPVRPPAARSTWSAFYGELQGRADRRCRSARSPDPLEQTPCAATDQRRRRRAEGLRARDCSPGRSRACRSTDRSATSTSSTPSLNPNAVDHARRAVRRRAEVEVDAGRAVRDPAGRLAGSLTPRIDASYQDDIYTGVDYQGETSTDRRLHAGRTRALTWRNPDDDLSVSLEVTNLTDEYYYVSLFDLRAAGAGLDKAQPGRPREWAVTVKKTF